MANERVRVSEEFRGLLSELTSTDDESFAVFDTLADALVFAAAVGFYNKSKEPIKKHAGEPVRIEIFDTRKYMPFINMISIMDDSNVSMLEDSNEAAAERVKIFEAYSNGGLGLLKKKISGYTKSARREKLFNSIGEELLQHKGGELPELGDLLG